MTQSFKQVLKVLPDIEHIDKINLYDQNDNLVVVIENMQGTQGSLKVYFYLYKNFKKINSAAAQKGLELFSEHTAEAKKNPGSHPNIDCLINIIKTNDTLKVETILR
jgi:hypothetical protein